MRTRSGFTLIELCIVLVIIGLIVGGVLVGRDLIAASAVRSQISQMERYQTAVNTFRDKYAALPGDANVPIATQFGLNPRIGAIGQGDGNGLLEGQIGGPSTVYGWVQQNESLMFWQDLTSAKLIEDRFVTSGASSGGLGMSVTESTAIKLSDLFPKAKIQQGNYIYAYSDSGVNFYGISLATQNEGGGLLRSNPGLTVAQAFAIDNKLDDKLPQSGTVTARYLNYTLGQGQQWAAGGGVAGAAVGGAGAGSSTSCYDNNSVASATHQYSITQNNGTGVNCALSFKFQ